MAMYGPKARQAARSSSGDHNKDSHHSAPLPKRVEGHVSSTSHPPALAKVHAHQYNRSQKHDSHTVAQPTQQPLAPSSVHQGTHNSAGMVSHHNAPLQKHAGESVSLTPNLPVFAKVDAHQFMQSQKHGSSTVAQGKGKHNTANLPVADAACRPRR